MMKNTTWMITALIWMFLAYPALSELTGYIKDRAEQTIAVTQASMVPEPATLLILAALLPLLWRRR